MSNPARPGHTLGVAIVIASPAHQLLKAARAQYEPTAGEMAPHVTILPPIDVDHDAMPAVMRHLDLVSTSTTPFTLELRGTGTFRPVSPVVFVVVNSGAAECTAIEARVRSGDMAVETRYPYVPHVTVAHDVADDVLDRATLDLAEFSATMTVKSMGLYERRNAGWELVRDFDFTGARQ